MIPEILEKLLNLFDDCHSRGKPLEIDINHDLIQIFPLPRKLILDLLTDQSISAISYLSNDQNILYFQNNLSLCPIDQNRGGSCDSSTCQQLHICRDCLLNNNCSQFKSYGKCSNSHSLSTNHNEKILHKFNLSSEDKQIFQFISRLTRLSSPSPSSNQSKIIVQTINRQDISDDLIDQWLGEHKSLLIDQQLINLFTAELIFDDDEVASMMQNFITKHHSTTVLVNKNIPSDNLSPNDSANSDRDLHRQSRMTPIENTRISKLDNDRYENDLDQEVQLTNEKTATTFRGTFSNQLKTNDLNTNSKKSPSERQVTITFGRGRGRQISNTIPNAPSISREISTSLLKKQSPQSNMNTFSQNLTSKLSPSNDQSFSTTEKKLSFSHRLHSKTNEQFPQQIKTKSSENSSSSTPEITANNTNYISDQFAHHNKTESTISSESFARNSLPKIGQKQDNQNETHNNNYYSSLNNVPNGMISSSTSQDVNSKPRFVLRGHSSKNKEKSPITTRNQTPITYIYSKPFPDEHLCYLLGPGRQRIIEKDQCQILSCLPSGYCRLTNIEQGKDIEKQLYSILPERLNIEVVKTNDDLALFICSSAAENIFQQNQIHYAIISEPSKVRLNIEVINAPSMERRRSPLISTKNTTSSSTEQKHSQQSLSDGKFHINATNSSIDVISGDISQIQVDMMICISTSNNLRNSVLRRAGSKIESDYKERYNSIDALLLDGGSTKAHKILFVPWETEFEETETTKTQKSLSDLVRWCIDQAHNRKMKSISFPPIGTGQLGLDPGFVCEAMISAASERLHQYEMDVLFVIYSSSGMNDDDECYQVFRIYLDSLCEQIVSTKISTPMINNERKISKSFDTKKQSVRRDIQSKRIITLSDSRNINQHHNFLIKSLEKLMFEKTFDLSLIEPSLTDQVDLLIDICLQNHLIPRIDLSREELTLRGDRDSCFQCFSNLRQGKKIHQYSYVSIQNGEKSDEKNFNSYISLKIDEAFAVGETNIYIEDDDQMIFNIDLNKLQVQINKNRQSTFLVKKPLNVDSKIRIPLSWSPSLLMIRTIEMTKSSYESLKCFRIFQETMSTSDWQIERIDSIENYPLYIHFMSKKVEEIKLYFHGCSYSSVQSIIHYGLHSTNALHYGDQFKNSSNGSICLTRDVLNSHLYGTRRSTDGKHYLFAVEIAKKDINDDFILLSNNDTHLALPTYLIVYRRRNLH